MTIEFTSAKIQITQNQNGGLITQPMWMFFVYNAICKIQYT